MFEQLNLYRKLLRTIKLVFKNDIGTIGAAKIKLRSSFEKNRSLLDEKKIRENIKYGHDIVQFLLKNIAQGVWLDSSSTGNSRYLVKIEKRHEISDNEPSSILPENAKPAGPCKVKCQGCSCQI